MDRLTENAVAEIERLYRLQREGKNVRAVVERLTRLQRLLFTYIETLDEGEDECGQGREEEGAGV